MSTAGGHIQYKNDVSDKKEELQKQEEELQVFQKSIPIVCRMKKLDG